MNKDLQHNVYDVPNDIIEKISSVLSSVNDHSAHGVQRAKKLCSEKKVTYGQLKRIIHDIKTIDRENDKLRYELYGGELMEKWAKSFLDGQRMSLKNRKMGSHKINNNTGMNGLRKNAFIQSHEKKSTTKVPVNILKSNSDETSVSPITSLGIFEEIKRIKNIINY